MMGDEGDEDDGDDQPFTCHFCGRYDERFTPNNLDLHYWQECPMLVNCPGCGQVIKLEIKLKSVRHIGAV